MTADIASEDITVYKILVFSEGKYVGPFYPDLEYTDGLNVAHGNEMIKECVNRLHDGAVYQRGYEINGGFLHAYLHEHWAQFKFRGHGCVNSEDIANIGVYKMTIPKGTRFFRSASGREVCAKKLVWDQSEEPLIPMDMNKPYCISYSLKKGCLGFVPNRDAEEYKKNEEFAENLRDLRQRGKDNQV